MHWMQKEGGMLDALSKTQAQLLWFVCNANQLSQMTAMHETLLHSCRTPALSPHHTNSTHTPGTVQLRSTPASHIRIDSLNPTKGLPNVP